MREAAAAGNRLRACKVRMRGGEVGDSGTNWNMTSPDDAAAGWLLIQNQTIISEK